MFGRLQYLRSSGRALALAAGGGAVLALGTSNSDVARAAAAAQQLFAWGEASVTSVSLPARPLEVGSLAAHGASAREVAFGSRHAAALDERGQLWLWNGAEGSLRPSSPGPWRLKLGETIASVASTDRDLVLTTARGRALVLADVGEWSAGLSAPAGSLVTLPTPPRALGGDASRRRIVSAACGSEHILLVDNVGALLACGSNRRGQLGLGEEPEAVPSVPEPRLVGGALASRKVTAASCGEEHSVVLTADGSIFAFGDDRFLQLGVRDGSVASIKTQPELRTLPTQLDLFAHLRAGGFPDGIARAPELWRPNLISAGGKHTLVSFCEREQQPGASGRTVLVAYGYGRMGQLGDGQFRHISAPREVRALSGLEEWDEAKQARVPICIRQLAAGAEHSAALLSSGDVMVWGANGYSQQGTGNRVGNPAPARVRALTGTRVGRISCARNSCAAWADASAVVRR
jgi:nucleolar protein 9